MNVSLPTLFNTYYNWINDKLSNLSPLQKRVAIFAIAYFSLATLGYLIYSCYQAYQISKRKEDEEEILSPTPLTRQHQGKESAIDETDAEHTMETPSPHPSFAMKELKKKLEQRQATPKDVKATSSKVTEAAKGVQEISQIRANLRATPKVAKVAADTHSLKKEEKKENSKIEPSTIDVQEKEDLKRVEDAIAELNPSDEQEEEQISAQTDPVDSSLVTLEALEELRNLSDSPQDIDQSLLQAVAGVRLSSSYQFPSPPSSSSSSCSSSAISDVEPSIHEERDKEIQARLEKNQTAARIQQEAEKAKGFIVTVVPSPNKFSGMSIHSEEKILEMRQVGIASSRGRRQTMEDMTEVNSLSFSIQGHLHQASVFAVFDGHVGAEAAIFAKENLMQTLKDAMENHNQKELTDVGIWDALKACFKNLDNEYQGPGGTTASVVFHLGSKIWVATAGDSRTILVKNGKTIQASEDAKPTIPRYQKKIEKLGGYIADNRVNAMLSTARAIGDKTIVGDTRQCCVSPDPKITCYSSDESKEGYLILGCDGLYDVATTNEVGQAIQEMADQKLSPDQMATQLVYHALFHGSKDNVSIIVVKL